MEEIENLEFEIRALQDRVESLTEELKKPTNPMNGLTGLPDQVTSLNRRLLTLQYQINRFEEILSDSRSPRCGCRPRRVLVTTVAPMWVSTAAGVGAG
jgi:predicted  nucleic acid-binding Zn-ribbon protein